MAASARRSRARSDRFNLDELSAGLGTTFETMGIALKFYSCVGSNHTTLDAIRDIRKRRPFTLDRARQHRRARLAGHGRPCRLALPARGPHLGAAQPALLRRDAAARRRCVRRSVHRGGRARPRAHGAVEKGAGGARPRDHGARLEDPPQGARRRAPARRLRRERDARSAARQRAFVRAGRRDRGEIPQAHARRHAARTSRTPWSRPCSGSKSSPTARSSSRSAARPTLRLTAKGRRMLAPENSATKTLADFAIGLSYDDLPAAGRRAAQEPASSIRSAAAFSASRCRGPGC